jgi:hypothetical protein
MESLEKLRLSPIMKKRGVNSNDSMGELNEGNQVLISRNVKSRLKPGERHERIRKLLVGGRDRT